jgi:lysozyme
VDISKRGIDLIIGAEGKHKLMPDGTYKAYLDTLAKPPVWTLYCGLTKGIKEGSTCTAEEGDKMFAKECAVYEDAVERLVHVPLNQNQFDALVSFVYNCGPGALEHSTLLTLLNQGKYEQVPAQLMRWTHAGGTEYPGLVTRRRAEGALFMEPMPAEQAAVQPQPTVDEPNPAPQMPQRVEEKPAATAVQTVTKSKTILGAAIAFFGVAADKLVQVYDWLFSVAKEAGPEVLNLKTSLDPFDALFAAVKASMPVILLGVTVAGLGVVVARRISAGHEGRPG